MRAWSRATPFAVVAAVCVVLLSCIVRVGHGPSAATAQALPGASPCVLHVDKLAEPDLTQLGEAVTVTLTAVGECPERPVPVHVVLAMDASTSMNGGGKLDGAKRAATRFVEGLDLSLHRVGVTRFDYAATALTELTNDRNVAIAAIEGIRLGPGTNIAAGIDTSREMLERGRRPAQDPPIEAMIVMSDGRQSRTPGQSGPALVIAAAERAKAAGILVATICFGNDCQADVMRLAASRADLYFDAADADSLLDVYERLAGELVRTAVRSLTIIDTLPTNMHYVPRSASPAPDAIGSDWIRWTWAVMPATGVTASLQVEPQQPGRWPTNVRAAADFTDTNELAGSVLFPVPEVVVIAPTPTSTSTPTPTATATSTSTPTNSPTATLTSTPTATPVPSPVYLPVVVRERCVPENRRVDAVLVLDASSSMLELTFAGRSKLQAAQAASRRFMDGLRLHSGDQVALVTFNNGARLAQPLTSDRNALERALSSVSVAAQTRLDLGIREGRTELMTSRHRRASRPVLVVLTDGLANPVPVDEALVEAEVAKALDHVVFAVGIGHDLDRAALAAMSSRPDYFFVTADGEGLPDIFAAIAETIPCPVSSYWGRR